MTFMFHVLQTEAIAKFQEEVFHILHTEYTLKLSWNSNVQLQ